MIHENGFTLIEIIIVIAILVVIAGFGMSIDLNVFKMDSFQNEEAKVVAILEKARSRSMANMFNTAHGVCYVAPDYIIFRENDSHCTSGVSSNELIPANTTIASNSSTVFPTISFNRLTGNTIGAIIHITDNIKTRNININNEGAINR